MDDNDVLILNLEPKKDKDGDDMPSKMIFGVVDSIGEDIVMINCNDEGFDEFKNYIFATNLVKNYDKTTGQLVVYRINKKKIDTVEEFKEELKLKGKEYTFGKTRKIVDVETEKDKASSLGCNLFKFIKKEPNENVKNLKNSWVEINFNDGSKINIYVFERRGSKLMFEFEPEPGGDENEGVTIINMNGDAEKFAGKLRNKNLKELNYGIIDIKDLSKLNEDDNEVLIELIYKNKNIGKSVKIQYPLKDIKSFKVLEGKPKNLKDDNNDNNDNDDNDDEQLSVKEYEEILKNNPLLMKALLQRPGLIGAFIGMPDTGLVATEDMMGKFSNYVNKNKNKINFIKFKSGNIVKYRVSANGSDLNGLVAKSKFNDKGTVYIYTNGNKTIPTSDNYKFKFKLVKDFNKDVGNDKYGVEYFKKSKDGKKREKEEIEIIVASYGDEKEKK